MRPDALRDSLERAIADDPDDLAAHMAYGDYLAEQGDPRGEFIQVQLALEDETKPPAERKRLQKRERQLLDAHAAAWLGELAPFTDRPGGRHTFRRGWLDTLHIATLTVNYARALVRSPQTRQLRDLTVVYAASEEEDNEHEPGDDVPTWEHDRVQFVSLHPLVRSPHLGNVRRFHLGNVEAHDDYNHWEGSYTLGIAAVDLIARMPRIEEVSLWTRGVNLGKLFALPMPRLRTLQVYHAAERHPLEVLAANPTLGRLAALRFHPHYHRRWGEGDDTDPEVAYLPLSAVTALVEATNLPALEHLQLRLSSLGDEGVRRLIASGLLDRLRVLDLRHGCVTDEGARLLADCPDTRRLDRLDLNRNHLTAAGVALLKSVGITAQVDDQWPANVGDYPRSYLQEGDFE